MTLHRFTRSPLFLPCLLLILLIIGMDLAHARPRIGLALSGGGARGAAHVGILKEIERLHIPVDYVAGTSMGSVVGGLYAMGMSPEEIEQAIQSIDWTAIFNDAPERHDRRMRRKLDDRDYLIDNKPGVDEQAGKVNLVPALIQGQKLELALRKFTLPASDIHDFDDLRIPFRAVTTDVVSGEAVVLGSGDLATAIRASMAVPAVFAPVEIGDRLLVDGGLAMNLPVSVVRDMGADIIIAVDIGGPRRDREEINNVLEMLDQIASLVTWSNTQEQIENLGPRDLLIVPPLGRQVIASDFNKMEEAIAIGEQEAERNRSALRLLSIPPAEYAAYRRAHTAPSYQEPIVDRVEIHNNSRLSDQVIARRIKLHPGERLDPDALAHQLMDVYDQDSFETVHYRVSTGTDAQTTLRIDANRKSWGTSSLQAGMELSSSGAGDSRFNIAGAYTRLPLNSLNGEWRTQAQLGDEPGIFSAIYQPLDPLERWYVLGGIGYFTTALNLFEDDSRDHPSAEYLLARYGAWAGFGHNLGHWGRIGVQYSRFRGDADVHVGDSSYHGYQYDTGAAKLVFNIDTLDSANFPTRGWSGEVFLSTSREWLGASDEYEQAGLNLLHAMTFDSHTVLAGLTFARTFGDDSPLQSYYRLGGLLNLSGFDQRALSGPDMGLARLIYMQNFNTDPVKTYGGVSFEAGNVWQDESDIGLDDLHYAGSLFVGADTFLGPLYLGYGLADGGNSAFYLYLGRPWNQPLQ